MPYAHIFAPQVDADLWILESSPRELSLRWVQTGRCHYGEHRWVLVNARRAGVCAVSGSRIKVGDKVYRPSSNAALIAAGVQILESELAQMLPREGCAECAEYEGAEGQVARSVKSSAAVSAKSGSMAGAC